MFELTYQKFMHFAGELARGMGESAGVVFGDLGLFLEDTPHRWDYHCTPLNVLTFASTGGDGVHFSFLHGQSDGRVPVVMTVPMSDENNLVLSENFSDFLRLGYFRGFFAMEGLIYDWTNAVSEFTSPDSEQSPEEEYLLARIRAEFGLLPPNLEYFQRIRTLQQRYQDRLPLPDFDEWQAQHGV